MDLPAGLRPVTDADASGVIALIDEAFREYPGCVLDLDGIDADLLTPATSAAHSDSHWWVVEDAGRIVATIGSGPLVAGRVELKRLYVARSHRRQGLASALVALVHAHARHVGAEVVELWSDTRFRDAHRLYGRLGYRRTGAIRSLEDPSESDEWHFEVALPAEGPRVDAGRLTVVG